MKAFFISLLLLSSFWLHAQERDNKQLRWGATISAAIPTGIFSSVYSLNAAANIRAGLPVSPKFTLIASAGYSSFLRKGGGEGISFIPFLAGAQYYFTPDAYLGMKAGTAISLFDDGIPVFSFEPALGFRLSDHFEISAHYNAYAQYNYIVGGAGIGLTYLF